MDKTKPLSVIFVILLLQSCLSEKLPEPMVSELCDTIDASYVASLKDIIDKNCAYSGCHIAGFPTGDFTSYEGLQSRINNGKVKARVQDLREMPPNYAPVGKPKELTAEELEIFNCWISSGYPEQ